ncbi:hypothetical protein BS47DRAFT_1340814 [Hydnum rufescens UP504]|uniref:PPM-type phosphatase domain-containing protein n=1 Tax=Hydnum rufescens UP504 TaxID=1448309 RepID=A0A9P6DZY7_9AGAM|nr:hypothetical protein BS47DRAFT_1340814 [Hydnum rufescens UP504]
MGWPGAGPFIYTILPEPFLSSELARLSNSSSERLSDGIRVDSLTFQPCLLEEERSQDRLFTQEIPFGLLTGIFDGHFGHEVADLAVAHLPGLVATALDQACANNGGSLKPEDVSKILSEQIVAFDAKMASDIKDLFPSDLSAIEKMDPDEVSKIIEDLDVTGSNHAKVLRGMRGSTALLALVDKQRENLWIANLGDCQAVMGSKTRSGRWIATPITVNHSGTNPDEVLAVRNQHPGEPLCIVNGRVLGSLAVTRALGDFVFKLPPIYTSKIFLGAERDFALDIKYGLLPRCRTPPYISNIPDVFHLVLPPLPSSTVEDGKEDDVVDRFLILCSDGLISKSLLSAGYRPSDPRSMSTVAAQTFERETIEGWVRVAGARIDAANASSTEDANPGVKVVRGDLKGDVAGDNLALAILRDILGGDDADQVSQVMTVEMRERFMDDTTIQVIRL